MASIGELTARLGLDTAEFRRNAAAAEDRIKALSGSMREGVNDAVKYGAAMSAAGAVLAGAFIKSALDAGREIQNLSRIANESVEQFQRQAYAARTVGIESDKLADIYKDVQDKVGDFLQNGGGPLQDFFTNIAPKVGVTARQFQNLSGPQALQLYVDSLEKANVAQGDLVFYMEAIASDATNLLPLLQNGAKGMQELGDQAESAGLVMSSFDVQALVEAQNTVQQLTATVRALGTTIVADLAPYIQVIGKEFLSAGAEGGKFSVDIAGSMSNAAHAIGYIADVLRGVEVAFASALAAEQAFGTGVLTGVNYIVRAWTEAVNAINSGILTIGRAYNAIPGVPDIDLQPYIVNANNYAGRLDDLQDKNAEMQASTAQTFKSLQDLLAQPMPSDGIDKWWANVQTKVAEFKRQMSDAVQTAGVPGGGVSGLGINTQAAAAAQAKAKADADKAQRDREQQQGGEYGRLMDVVGYSNDEIGRDQQAQQQNQNQFDQIRGAGLSDQQVEQERYEKNMEFLQQAADGRIQIEGDANAALEKERERHAEAMAKIQTDNTSYMLADQRNFLQAIEAAQKTSGVAQIGIVTGALADIASTTASHNKTMFQLNKAAGIANAIVSTYTAAANALKDVPFPANLAAAAVVTAAGLARVAAISSQQYGGGTSATGAAGADGVPVSDTGNSRLAKAQNQGQVLTVHLVGGDDASKTNFRSFIDQFNEYVADGGKVKGINAA